jgi:hypothetical protein
MIEVPLPIPRSTWLLSSPLVAVRFDDEPFLKELRGVAPRRSAPRFPRGLKYE